MSRLIVTGATGFIGRHCLALLANTDYEVHAVSSRAMVARQATNIHWHQVNLLDAAAVQRWVAAVQAEECLHLAWYVEHGKFWHSLENYRWVQASLQLAQSFYEQGGQRLVVTGTCVEYDWRYGYCVEGVTPLYAMNAYGLCKRHLFELLTAYAQQQARSFAWGRIFFLYGEGEAEQRLVAYLIRALLQNEVAHCSAGTQRRDFLHVRDVAAALVALLASPVQGAVNIGSGVPTQLLDIYNYIGQALAKRELILAGSRPLPQNEPALLVADVRRLTDEVGFQPQIGLAAGLGQTIAWWKEQLV